MAIQEAYYRRSKIDNRVYKFVVGGSTIPAGDMWVDATEAEWLAENPQTTPAPTTHDLVNRLDALEKRIQKLERDNE